MKTRNIRHAVRTISPLIALVCFFFINVRAHADDMYVANYADNTIGKFNTPGVGTIFANTFILTASYSVPIMAARRSAID